MSDQLFTFGIVLVLALTTILLTSCREEVQNPPAPGTVIYIPAHEWRVVDKPTLDTIYVNSGKTLAETQDLNGFVGKRPDGTIVVYTLPPKYVDDQVTLSLGHETMHIPLGDFHK